jgi:hexosaminidase
MKDTDTPGLALEWEFIGNNHQEGNSSALFTLINTGTQKLGNSGWALYFNQMGSGVIQESVTGKVQIEHVNGDLVRIIPTSEFTLNPGEAVNISYNKPGQVLKENEAPLGPYMVHYSSLDHISSIVPFESYTIKPFPTLDKIFPEGSSVPLPDAAWIYGQNKHQSLLKTDEVGLIIPSPVYLKSSHKNISLGGGLKIHYGEGLKGEANHLAGMLDQVMGFKPSVTESEVGGANIIKLELSLLPGEMDTEGYTLSSDTRGGVIIAGSEPAGVFYGIQSLLSLLPVKVWSLPQSSIEIEVLTIEDKPAFAYRGMHLDIARNFIEPDAIKKLIRAMAFYKLNKLHLHITDDEGWRLEIASLPELTQFGSYRGHTEDHKDHILPNYGSGPLPKPGVGHGSGFLTREDFIEILKLADAHHIEVIPEINFPGHARAAIYAMETRYDRLMKEGNADEAEKFRLIDPNDKSIYNSAQNYDDNVVCVCLEAPYLFYATVVDEIMDMYEEAGLKMRVMHAGGDEVPHGSWTDSPVCEAFMQKNPEISGADNLQAYCEARLYEILEERDLIMAGWEEIAMKKNDADIWVPNPDFVGKKMLPYVWNNLDNNLDLGNRLANTGFPVILCNATNFYFDLGYNQHPAEPGHYWGGLVNTKRAFEFVPYDLFKCSTTDRYWQAIDTDKAFDGMEKLKPEAYENIIGLQGHLWSEFIKGGEMLEYFYLPKFLGLAERAWSGQQKWGSIEEKEERNQVLDQAWNEFANVVGQREMPRLDYLFGGFNYRLPPPGAIVKDGQLFANIDFPGLEIRYTLDGSEPEKNSLIYSGPVDVSGPVRLRSFDTRGRGSRISEVE